MQSTFAATPLRWTPILARASRQRKLVDQTGASWNQVALWLSRIKTLRDADMRVS